MGQEEKVKREYRCLSFYFERLTVKVSGLQVHDLLDASLASDVCTIEASAKPCEKRAAPIIEPLRRIGRTAFRPMVA